MAAKKKSGKRRYSKKAGKKVEAAMRERKQGRLRSGRSKKKVKSRKQAIAIGLSEARAEGAKVPSKKTSKKAGKKKSSRKKAGKKTSGRKKTGKKTSGRKKAGRKASRRRT